MKKSAWYKKVTEEIKGDMRGFFKFRFSDDGKVQEYNVWWQGLSPDVRITKHNMPEAVFNKFEAAVKSTASADSHKAFKEVIRSYME